MSLNDRCCVIDHTRKKCVDLNRNDGHCADLAECCVGYHGSGAQGKCMSKLRECRRLGNSWDPIGPMRPLNANFIFTETPGYATNGVLVEGFGHSELMMWLRELLDINCITKNALCSLVIALIAKAVLNQKVTIMQILVLTFLISVVKCCLAKM